MSSGRTTSSLNARDATDGGASPWARRRSLLAPETIARSHWRSPSCPASRLPRAPLLDRSLERGSRAFRPCSRRSAAGRAARFGRRSRRGRPTRWAGRAGSAAREPPWSRRARAVGREGRRPRQSAVSGRRLEQQVELEVRRRPHLRAERPRLAGSPSSPRCSVQRRALGRVVRGIGKGRPLSGRAGCQRACRRQRGRPRVARFRRRTSLPAAGRSRRRLRGISSTARPARRRRVRTEDTRLTIIRSSSAAGTVRDRSSLRPDLQRDPVEEISDSSALAPRSERLATAPARPTGGRRFRATSRGGSQPIGPLR